MNFKSMATSRQLPHLPNLEHVMTVEDHFHWHVGRNQTKIRQATGKRSGKRCVLKFVRKSWLIHYYHSTELICNPQHEKLTLSKFLLFAIASISQLLSLPSPHSKRCWYGTTIGSQAIINQIHKWQYRFIMLSQIWFYTDTRHQNVDKS